MLYPQYFIDDLKSRADLVRIIQPYAQDLKKKGANWMACCPFHQEKTPSFSVNPAKGFYKCFGCGKGGTAFNFLMEMEGLNFPEAIKRVAEMSGVMLPEPVDDEQYARSKQRRDERKQLADQVIELNQIALEFWEKELKGKNKSAKAARAYLEQRGISDDIQQQYHIGFSPDSWDSVLTLLRDFGASEDLIAQCGLISVNEEKERVYDRFRGRIMFPVLDVDGRPVAFGARGLTPEDQPKYLNSPETPAYVKGDHLYGLYQAKESIRKKKFAILVEGYLDLIALAQFGVTNVAASLGTAFTDSQCRLLKRFTERVVVNYDGDDAGIKAAKRAVEHLLPHDLDVKVLVLPEGKDPDDYIREFGADDYNRRRGSAQPFLQFALESSSRSRDLGNARQKSDAVEEIMPVIRAIRNSIQRRESFDQAMTYFHLEDSGIKRELWRAATNNDNYGTSVAAKSIVKAAALRSTHAEKRLLELLARDKDLCSAVIPRLEPLDYQNLASGEVFAAFVAIHNAGGEIGPETLLENLGDDEASIDIARDVLNKAKPREPETPIDEALTAAEGCVISLRSMAIESSILDISRRASLAERSGDTDLASTLINQQLELEKIRRELQRKAIAM